MNDLFLPRRLRRLGIPAGGLIQSLLKKIDVLLRFLLVLDFQGVSPLIHLVDGANQIREPHILTFGQDLLVPESKLNMSLMEENPFFRSSTLSCLMTKSDIRSPPPARFP